MNEPENCPLCGCPLASLFTCDQCGLWWTKRQDETAFEPYEDLEAPRTLVLRLRQGIPFDGFVILLAIAAFAWWALWVTLNAVLGYPSSGYSWAGFLVALPVGGAVAVSCSAMVVSAALHFVAPTTLDCDEAGLHLTAWDTWSGLKERFTRRRCFIARDQLRGATFVFGRGGGHQLFITLVSGWIFYTGWEGSGGAYAEHADSIASWLRATRPPSPRRGKQNTPPGLLDSCLISALMLASRSPAHRGQKAKARAPS